MPTVVFVSGFVPSDVGHGGNHRTYQILHDLESAVGKEHVVLVSYPEWNKNRAINPLLSFVRRARRRLAYYGENPLKLFAFNSFSPRGFSDHDFMVYYENLIRQAEQPIISVIEHTTFGALAQINVRYDVPTIICPQNLESLDASASYAALKRRLTTYVTATDLINEFNVLARCTERLFISKVEAGLVGGLGLPSRFYPYLPVGAIRKRLEWICQERAKGDVERGVFLLLGSAGHLTTGEAFSWFIKNAQMFGLPEGIRVVVVGGGTEKLAPLSSAVPGIELRGWLDQDELDRLLRCATGALAPQRLGFGALTRLSEFACGGIPVLLSGHAALALDVPPGVEIVDDSWAMWCSKMLELSDRSVGRVSTCGGYSEWEQTQPRALGDAIDQFDI